jgi:hypothetical protein
MELVEIVLPGLAAGRYRASIGGCTEEIVK